MGRSRSSLIVEVVWIPSPASRGLILASVIALVASGLEVALCLFGVVISGLVGRTLSLVGVEVIGFLELFLCKLGSHDLGESCLLKFEVGFVLRWICISG